jgi:hypothetical protein
VQLERSRGRPSASSHEQERLKKKAVETWVEERAREEAKREKPMETQEPPAAEVRPGALRRECHPWRS